jgi:hypothetical protein
MHAGHGEGESQEDPAVATWPLLVWLINNIECVVFEGLLSSFKILFRSSAAYCIVTLSVEEAEDVKGKKSLMLEN